jgi:ubiquinone/menaquinone biosynthesis C-methylase UbiE
MCNAVIQHIEPPIVFEVTLREFARVLKPGGVL